MTPTEMLLKQCNWLSVRQLVYYHTLTLLHKVLLEKKPDYIYKKISRVTRETRTCDRLTLVDKRSMKTRTAQRSFIPRSIEDWNKLPFELRDIQSKELFKHKLRQHIKENIPIK